MLYYEDNAGWPIGILVFNVKSTIKDILFILSRGVDNKIINVVYCFGLCIVIFGCIDFLKILFTNFFHFKFRVKYFLTIKLALPFFLKIFFLSESIL